MKFLIETGSERHTTSWQACQAKYASGPHAGKYLYQIKPAIVSTEWVKSDKHQQVVRTVYELPEGTDILIDYKGHCGPATFIIRLDTSQEPQEQEVGTSRLRTYTMKGRYVVVRDLVKEKAERLTQSQEAGF